MYVTSSNADTAQSTMAHSTMDTTVDNSVTSGMSLDYQGTTEIMVDADTSEDILPTNFSISASVSLTTVQQDRDIATTTESVHFSPEMTTYSDVTTSGINTTGDSNVTTSELIQTTVGGSDGPISTIATTSDENVSSFTSSVRTISTQGQPETQTWTSARDHVTSAYPSSRVTSEEEFSTGENIDITTSFAVVGTTSNGQGWFQVSLCKF